MVLTGEPLYYKTIVNTLRGGPDMGLILLILGILFLVIGVVALVATGFLGSVAYIPAFAIGAVLLVIRGKIKK